MPSCDACGTTILFGGVNDQGLRFCNAKCHAKGRLVLIARTIPPDVVARETSAVYRGPCPRCHGSGPIDVHTSYRVWSALIVTQWQNLPQISCRGCGVKNQLGNAALSLLVGWWGFPWGLIMTPIQIGRNIAALIKDPGADGPSKNLETMVRMSLASRHAPSASG